MGKKKGKKDKGDSFVHLHVHSEYSKLDGLSKLDEIAGKAATYEMPAIGITDHGNIHAAISFYRECEEVGVKPILGLEAYIAKESRFAKEKVEGKQNFHMLLLALDNPGFHNLIRITSASYEPDSIYYNPRVDLELLSKHAEGVMATTGCLGGVIPQLLLKGKKELAFEYASDLKDIFGDRLYVEHQAHSIPEENEVRPGLIEIGKQLNLKPIITGDSHYTEEGHAGTHDLVLCLGTGTNVHDENRFKFSGEDFHILSPAEMRAKAKKVLGKDLGRQACDTTLEIAERSTTELSYEGLQIPNYEAPKEFKNSNKYLLHLIEEGKKRRYGKKPESAVQERIDHEMSIISSMEMEDYFLIVADVVDWSKKNNIAVGPGRGSAAGSIVSYCLGITTIDPLKYDLIFERFLNPSRIAMPDIDLDFDSRYRGEVIQYITHRFGEDFVCQITTIGRYQAKGAVRAAARALGYGTGVPEKVSAFIPNIMGATPSLDVILDSEPPEKDNRWYGAWHEAEALRELERDDKKAGHILKEARGLYRTVDKVGVHPAGVLITPKPVIDMVPVYTSKRNEGNISQWDLDILESLGMLKLDILGLSNLGTISMTIDSINTRGEFPYDSIEDIPIDDKETFEAFSGGHTTGVFQFENPNVRSMLKEMGPDCLEDLSAVTALYRPGPMAAGIHTEYIKRKNGKSKIQSIHPEMGVVLDETYLLTVYQEQIMALSRHFAGFTMTEADNLRKACGKKLAWVMAEQKDKFINGVKEQGYGKKLGKDLWDIIEPFSDYAFNKSHSISYATIAYQTMWLKVHYPSDYIAALMTTASGNGAKLIAANREAKRLGITVQQPDVNLSDNACMATTDDSFIVGLGMISNFSSGIVDEREENGKFDSLAGFLARCVGEGIVNKRSIETLAYAGALDSLYPERCTISDNASSLGKLAKSQYRNQERSKGNGSLFDDSVLSELNAFDVSEVIGGLEDSEEDKSEYEKNQLAVLGMVVGADIYEKALSSLSKEQRKKIKKDFDKTERILSKPNEDSVRVFGVLTDIEKGKEKKRASVKCIIADDTGEIIVRAYGDLALKLLECHKGDPVGIMGAWRAPDGDWSGMITAKRAKRF